MLLPARCVRNILNMQVGMFSSGKTLINPFLFSLMERMIMRGHGKYSRKSMNCGCVGVCGWV